MSGKRRCRVPSPNARGGTTVWRNLSREGKLPERHLRDGAMPVKCSARLSGWTGRLKDGRRVNGENDLREFA